MRALSALLAIGTMLAIVSTGTAFADDDAALVTGRSVAVSGACDKITPVCAALGHGRLVPYDNECHARADGATSITFSGCFDEN